MVLNVFLHVIVGGGVITEIGISLAHFSIVIVIIIIIVIVGFLLSYKTVRKGLIVSLCAERRDKISFVP